MQRYDSILFDLDGTLWDSVPAVVEIWNRALGRAGIEPTLDYNALSRCMGLRIEQIFDRVIPQATEEQRGLVKKYCSEMEHDVLSTRGGVLYDKVEETLAALKSTHRLFIISNCQDTYMQAFFKAHDLRGYFEGYECAGRTGLSKGENIALVAKREKLARPVYIGDTVFDYEAALQANVPFIHAAYGFGEVEGVPAAKTFSEIPNLV